MKTRRYDYSISFTRICAMLFVIICHLGSYFGLAFVGQLFNVGVPIFYLISGYLYGNAEIKDIRTWLCKRLIRLYIPLLLWGICFFIITITRNNALPSFEEIIFFLLNLHGLNFLFYNMPDLASGPWFLTVIMLCYFFVVAYQLLEQRHKKINCIFHYGGIIVLCVFVILAYLGISLPISFLVGYGLKKRTLLEKRRPYNIAVAIVVAIIALGLRLGTKGRIDGTILYNQVIVVVSHCMLAAAFFIGVRWLFELFEKQMTDISSSKVMKWLDKISIYVYISHDWFIKDIFGLKLPLVAEFLIFFSEVFMVASILYILGESLNKKAMKLVQLSAL